MSKVVVVGSTNTDLTVRVPRIPAPGETALGREFRMTAGGKGANQAVAAARAGARVVFVTALGTDDFGQRALENLAREGIDIEFRQARRRCPSGVALIVVDERVRTASRWRRVPTASSVRTDVSCWRRCSRLVT